MGETGCVGCCGVLWGVITNSLPLYVSPSLSLSLSLFFFVSFTAFTIPIDYAVFDQAGQYFGFFVKKARADHRQV